MFDQYAEIAFELEQGKEVVKFINMVSLPTIISYSDHDKVKIKQECFETLEEIVKHHRDKFRNELFYPVGYPS